MNSLLIIDDDAKLGAMLSSYLEHHEMRLDVRHTGHLGLNAVAIKAYDMMLLDIMLPDLDGFQVLQKIRTFSDISVMLLTARGEAADRIRGLRLGADDYLPKPFDPDELVARIHAVLRRRALNPSSILAKPACNHLYAGDLEPVINFIPLFAFG
jgi:DNA-binding response OmpR family regulator